MPSHAHVSRSGGLRREIAALAARMMAEDGISDFGFAKRKAAKQLGATEADALPNNTEIEAEFNALFDLKVKVEVGDTFEELSLHDALFGVPRTIMAAALTLSGCAGGGFGNFSDGAPAPDVAMPGRWMLAAPNAPSCGSRTAASRTPQRHFRRLTSGCSISSGRCFAAP